MLILYRVYKEPDKEVETSDLISISDDQSDDTNRVVSVIPKDDIIQVIYAYIISINEDQSDDTNRVVSVITKDDIIQVKS